MFGGSEETNELNDFWVLDLKTNDWTPIESLNGPSPRSGAKMTFDPAGNQLFIIGRKLVRATELIKVSVNTRCQDSILMIFFLLFQSDFYLYDISRQSWISICDDTSLENGPSLVSDHQMCISSELRTIYIFGGKKANR